MNINELKLKVVAFFGESANSVIESEGLSLLSSPNELSRKFVAEYASSIRNLLYSDDEIIQNENFQLIQKVLIQAQVVKSRYDKAEIAIKKVQEKIKNNKTELILPEEVIEGCKIILNEKTPSTEFLMDSEKIYQLLIQTYCTNAAILSGAFSDKQEISIEELVKLEPRIAEHAKKTAFDQMCVLVFGYYNENYDELRKEEEIHSNHQINNLMEQKIKKNQILFGYVDMNPLTTPKFPRFATILSRRNGTGCSVEETYHLHKILNIQCVIAGNEIIVKVPVWYGFIDTVINPESSKPLDLNSILSESAKIAKMDPNEANQSSKIKEDQLLAQNYFNVFEQLATSTNKSYNNIINQLKRKANQYASN